MTPDNPDGLDGIIARMPDFPSWSNSQLTDYQDILLVTRERKLFPPGDWHQTWLDSRIAAIDEVLDSRVRAMFDVVVEELGKSPDTEAGLEEAIQAAMRRHPSGTKLPEVDTS
jgi:hypothetical protein